MWWWFKARRAHTVLPTVLASFVALVAVLQDALVELPSLLGGSAHPVLFVLLAPVPVCAGLLLCLESRLPAGEDSGVRRVGLLDVGLAVAVSALAVTSCAMLGHALDSSAALSTGRNTVFLIGLSLCARAFVGSSAVFAPVLWIFAVVLGGMSGPRPAFWTVLPQAHDEPYSAVAAVVALTAGLALTPFERRLRSR